MVGLQIGGVNIRWHDLTQELTPGCIQYSIYINSLLVYNLVQLPV